jgi:hypothetical protein
MMAVQAEGKRLEKLSLGGGAGSLPLVGMAAFCSSKACGVKWLRTCKFNIKLKKKLQKDQIAEGQSLN